MSPATATRLPAAERRRAIVEAATQLFFRGSYRGVTTAELAREAGVTEPVLYRHFASKRELYLACIEAAWGELRGRWEECFAGSPPGGVPAMARATMAKTRARKAFLASFWIQALTEAGDDEEIRAFLRAHMREVHTYVREALRRSQEAGTVAADRDPDAEAWIMIAGALMVTFADRLGGLLGQEDLDAIGAQRLRWLTGAG